MARKLPSAFVIEESELSPSIRQYEIIDHATSGFWDLVNREITRLARQHANPEELGAYKTDFTVKFEGGEHYKGYLGVRHPSRGDAVTCGPDASTHIVRFLEAHAGRRCPGSMSEEQHRAYVDHLIPKENQERAAAFRDTYALTDTEIEEALIERFDLATTNRRDLKTWFGSIEARPVVDALDQHAGSQTRAILYDNLVEVTGAEPRARSNNDRMAWIRASAPAAVIRDRACDLAADDELVAVACTLKERTANAGVIATIYNADAKQLKETFLDHAAAQTLVNVADRCRSEFEIFAEEPGQYGPVIQDASMAASFIDAEVDACDLREHLTRFVPVHDLQNVTNVLTPEDENEMELASPSG